MEENYRKQYGNVIDFLEARRNIIAEHGTSARGARSHLLEPLRKILNAPDVAPLFESFILNPSAHIDLIHTISGTHGIESTKKEMLQALAHLGIEKTRRGALDGFLPENWEDAVRAIRMGVKLAIFVDDWMAAEQLWLRLDERAIETGVQIPELQRLVMFEMGNLQAQRGDLEGAAEFYLLCEQLAAAEGRDDVLAYVRVMLGKALRAQGKTEEALAVLRKSAGWARGSRDQEILAHAETEIGASLADLGLNEDAAGHLNIASETADAIGAAAIKAEAAHNIASVLERQGRAEEAAAAITAAFDSRAVGGDIPASLSLLHSLFEINKKTGRWGEFLLRIQSVRNKIHVEGQFHFLGPLLILSADANEEIGFLHLSLHDLEEAAYVYQALEEPDLIRLVTKGIENMRERINKKGDGAE
jgi:tetratricopeptide (TPR) repeat protein